MRQAFKSYDEAGAVRRIQCLKYLVLATMLMESAVDPFDAQEAAPYKQDPEVLAMTNLVAAYQQNDILGFERILKTNKCATFLTVLKLLHHSHISVVGPMCDLGQGCMPRGYSSCHSILSCARQVRLCSTDD